MRRLPKWSTRLLMLTVVLLLAEPQSGPEPSAGFLGSSVVQAASPEPIRVAITLPFAPWEYRDQSGKLTGFEVEMLREIGRHVNREIQFIDVKWEGIFAGLTANKYDVIASTVSITCERQKVVDFSLPYYNFGVSITVRKSDRRIQRVEDLAGMVVGVDGAGTTSHLWLLRNRFKYGIKEIKVYEGESFGAFLDLQAGRIDAAAGDYPSALYYIRDKPVFEVRLRGLTADYVGLVFRKGDPLIGSLNAAIDTMKRDGTMARLHQEHLGSVPPADSAVVRVLPPVVLPSDCSK